MMKYQNKLSLEQLGDYIEGKQDLALSGEESFIKAVNDNYQYFLSELEAKREIYGSTTGFGSSSKNVLDREQSRRLQSKLVRYHGCGVGELLSEKECAATLVVRLNCLTNGLSGISFDLLRQLSQLVEKRVFPAIPSQGSVGASGDLTPLSYVAACLEGDRNVYHKGEVRPTKDVFEEQSIETYELKEREALSIMNGTSAMSGIAALGWLDASQIAESACSLTGLFVELLQARTAPFTARLNAAKPHEGQILAARHIYEMLNSPEDRYFKRGNSIKGNANHGIQDKYSLRCAPQVIGVLFDSLSFSKKLIETEINSVSDNPVFDHLEGLTLNGGLFYGGHIAMASDLLKTSVYNVINLLDRQFALLLEEAKRGISENLVARNKLGDEAKLNHGFKAMQITMSALASEIQKNSLPMGIFSRPTESSNQDIVSMGTIAARDLRKITEMARDAVSIYSMALVQAFYLVEETSALPLKDSTREYLDTILSVFTPVVEDRQLDLDIEKVKLKLFGDRV